MDRQAFPQKSCTTTTMKNAEKRLSWALQVCLKAKMRLTPIRKRILDYLVTHCVPVSLETLSKADEIHGSCDTATAYRTLMLFNELEVIRQLSFPNKISYFVLNVPGESNHFMICRCCGQITQLPPPEYVAQWEHEVSVSQGYTRLYHELVFFGICPACQKHPPGVVCAKVQPRMRLNGRFKPGLISLK